MTSRMFPFITCTWNPLGGECKHQCVYCWAKALAKRYMHKKYTGAPRIIERELRRTFSKDDFVFVQDMSDLFGDWVPTELIQKVLKVAKFSEAQFLLLTKNPKRYFEFLHPDCTTMRMPTNCVLGVTMESNVVDVAPFSKAPSIFDRLYYTTHLAEYNRIAGSPYKLFVSVEPIMDFDLERFVNALANWIRPWAVAVGYDNYSNKLPEPRREKTEALIKALEGVGITVYRKTIREAYEGCPTTNNRGV